MLRIALPKWRAASNICQRCYSRNVLSPLADAHRSRVSTALKSDQPLDAYDLLLEYHRRNQTIPNGLMIDFFQAVRKLRNPFAVHLFASLVTVDQVGRRHFIANVSRVIKLHLATQNWEQCLQFVREIEYYNKGELQLPYDTLEALLIAAKWHNDVEIAQQSVQIMLEAYPHVYARSWGMLMQLALDTEHYATLLWVYDNALKPGYLVLDDASYLRMARVASRNGDLRICEWAALRIRRRQKAFEAPSSSTSLELYICLVEAAARSSLTRTETVQASIRAVSRYLVRLGSAATQIRTVDLPQVVEALAKDDENLEYFHNMFSAIVEDPSVSADVKTITFNLLLAAELDRDTTSLERIVNLTRTGRTQEILLNEDSILLLLDVAVKTNASRDTVSQVVLQRPTKRVLKKANHILQEGGLLSEKRH